MADNYLERHREDYEQRKAEWLHRKHAACMSASSKRPRPREIERPEDEAL